MPNDKRREAVEAIREKIREGKRLSEEDVRENLYLARDFSLLYLTERVVAGEEVSKPRIRTFNALQNAVERHEILHPADRFVEPITICYELELPCKKEIEA